MTEGIGQDSVTTITIDSAFFEHLLNCMCNQKYLPTLDRPMSEREKKDQDIIDVAYHKARDLQSQKFCNMTPEELARFAHKYQQELGPSFFGESWDQMSIEWDDIPEKHKQHIIAVYEKVLEHFREVAQS